jgi:hypothetical protein
VEIDCPVSIGGSKPRTSQIVNVYGPIGIFGDPGAAEIDVIDEGGNDVPPLPGPVNPAGTPPFFDVVSKDVDGPPRTVCYLISIKLRDPGVRTQILKCQVWVRHGHVRCFLNSFGTPVASGSLVVEADVIPGPPLPPIHQVEVVFNQQTPPWLAANPMSLPPGWAPQVLADRIQFFLQDPVVGTPITAGGGPKQFQFTLQTQGGQPPTAGHVRCYDAQPRLVALEHITQFMHFP